MVSTIQRPVGRAGETGDAKEPEVRCQGYRFGDQPQFVTRSRAHIRALSCPHLCQGCQSQGVCNPPQPNGGTTH